MCSGLLVFTFRGEAVSAVLAVQADDAGRKKVLRPVPVPSGVSADFSYFIFLIVHPSGINRSANRKIRRENIVI